MFWYGVVFHLTFYTVQSQTLPLILPKLGVWTPLEHSKIIKCQKVWRNSLLKYDFWRDFKYNTNIQETPHVPTFYILKMIKYPKSCPMVIGSCIRTVMFNHSNEFSGRT